MNNLLKISILFEYYKDNNILDKYTFGKDTNIITDTEVMKKLNEKLYITTYDKICEKKEENAKLKDKVEQLQDKIDSAINYIEENCYDEERKIVINELYNEIPELLDILKGSDNNE